MKRQYALLLALLVLFSQCTSDKTATDTLHNLMTDVPGITGNEQYLNSPYVTAGDRLYMVGHQNGQFPDLGWHVTGEMGGIWDHPIKLMDGFTAALKIGNETHCLSDAHQFVNFPFANVHRYETPPGLRVGRFQFVPDGVEAIVVEYTFTNQSNESQEFSFEFNGMIDLRPAWLGERTGMADGTDNAHWDEAANCIVGKDSLNDWFVVFGSSQTPEAHDIGSTTCNFERAGNGVNALLRYPISVPAGGKVTLPMVIAGSYQSVEAAKQTLQRVQRDARQLLTTKKMRYEQIAQTAKLTIPDKQLQEAFTWVKFNTDWLIRDVPEIGRGLSAGIPDYPWWFGCDNTYALRGVLATGRTDIVFSTLRLLKKLSEETNGNGRVIHEASTNGAVFNPGNVNETPHFASMVWIAYQWTGDRAFLEEFYPFVKQGLDWLLAENDADGNLYPDGFGMMEIHGLESEMIDVAVYTQQAFADAAKMAQEMGDAKAAADYQQKAEQLREQINADFWVPEFNSYADFIGTAAEARHLIDDAIVRADTLGKPWAVAELKATKAKISDYPAEQKQGFVVHHNWVVNTPMEMGIADREKALAALETGSKFVNPFGVFVTGIDRDESAGTDDSSFAEDMEIFSYTGAVMTLPTGVQAIAENNYGRPDQALDYLHRLTNSFSYALPGSMYEVSPDFGMMTQAWNVYSLAYPIVQQFFGIQPKAQLQEIHISPQMPAAWNEASLENVTIGENELSVQFKREKDAVELTFEQKQDWKLIIKFPRGTFKTWTVNGEAVSPKAAGDFDQIEVSGMKITIGCK